MNSRSSVVLASAFLIAIFLPAPVFGDLARNYGGSFKLAIPSDPNTKGWMTDAAINVTDHFTILDLDVQLSLQHTSVFDLQIFLESPAGQSISLSWYDPESEYFPGANYTQTIFDDEAKDPIDSAQAPFTGRFKPEINNYLSDFDGQDAFGTWKLQIYDAYERDTGTLQNVELFFNTPEPATAILLILGILSPAFLRSNKKLP